jgi:ABC-type phosphate transport system substrate-binding protein
MNKKQAAKAAKALEDILSGKAKGWGAANPNFPNGEMINPVYSPSSGKQSYNGPRF